MKLSFSTLGCPDWSIERVAEKAKEYGYAGVELRVHDDGKHLSPADSPDKVRLAAARFRDAGVPVFAVSGYASYSAADAGQIRNHEELTRRLIEMATVLGAGFVRVYGGVGEKDEDLNRVAERAVRTLRPLAGEAFEKGVRLAIETHDAWTRGTDLIRIVEGVGSPGLAVCFDVHNTLQSSGEWVESYEILRRHIGYCHVKDACPASEGGARLVMVGAGDLPLRAILRRLATDRFDGYLSFEWEKRWYPELEAPERVFPQYLFKMRQEWADAGRG